MRRYFDFLSTFPCLDTENALYGRFCDKYGISEIFFNAASFDVSSEWGLDEASFDPQNEVGCSLVVFHYGLAFRIQLEDGLLDAGSLDELP